MKALNIIETGYRATLEEQDDPGVWLSYTLKVAGGDVDVLLRGNAVNYAVKGQDSTGLQYGAWQQTQPPRLADNIASLTSKGIVVFIVSEDLQERGLEGVPLVEGLTPVTRKRIGASFRPLRPGLALVTIAHVDSRRSHVGFVEWILAEGWRQCRYSGNLFGHSLLVSSHLA